MNVEEIQAESEAFARAAAWAEAHFERSLLYLADMRPPLVRHARFFLATRGADVAGVAVHFTGFGTPTLSCAARDGQTCDALIGVAVAAAASPIAPVLITHEDQPLSAAVAALPAAHDGWLARACAPYALSREVCRVTDAHELTAFYVQHGVHHVHADMLDLGHVYGIRDHTGHLICAGGLHFTIADRYAQLGGLFTVAQARRRSCATRVLAAICSSLAAAGVQRCGLFAEGADPALLRFYAARGYRMHGRFALRTLCHAR